MRVASFSRNGSIQVGIVKPNSEIVPVRDLLEDAPADTLGLIAAGPRMWSAVERAASSAPGQPLARVDLRAPIPLPRRNVFCVGWNYADHFEEGKSFRGQGSAQEIPEYPSLFSKNPGTVVGPEAPVFFPAPHSTLLDWEAELAVIVAEGGIDISEDNAMGHVFGYTCANDVSVRDVQRRHGGQWFKGKNFDTHLPMGPWIVTADALDASDLAICSRVNGATKQDSRTKYMVFKIPRLIAEISAGCELWPGDIIITGTPSGVGFARTPPEYMKVGDVVEVEIEGIGVLRNTITGRS